MEINRIWALTERRQHADALSALAVLELGSPEKREVLYLRALNLRLADPLPEALGP